MTDAQTRIVPMAWSDVVRFAEMRNHMDEETDNLVAKPKERKDTGARVLARMLVNRRLKTLVAKEGPHIVGYVSLIFAKFAKMKGNAYLTVAVRGSHRGRGLGSKLMAEAELLAKRHKVRRIELEVFGSNPAVRLYERLGYKVEGRRKDAVEDNGRFDDVVFMAKFI